MQLEPAEYAAAVYSRNRGFLAWGVVDFRVPIDVLIEYGFASSVLSGMEGVLVFPDRTTSVPVRYPDDLGGIVINMTWRDFVAENRRLGGHVSWPYDLIIGPISGRIPGYRNVNQILFNDLGIIMLNDLRVDREVTSTGYT